MTHPYNGLNFMWPYSNINTQNIPYNPDVSLLHTTLSNPISYCTQNIYTPDKLNISGRQLSRVDSEHNLPQQPDNHSMSVLQQPPLQRQLQVHDYSQLQKTLYLQNLQKLGFEMINSSEQDGVDENKRLSNLNDDSRPDNNDLPQKTDSYIKSEIRESSEDNNSENVFNANSAFLSPISKANSQNKSRTFTIDYILNHKNNSNENVNVYNEMRDENNEDGENKVMTNLNENEERSKTPPTITSNSEKIESNNLNLSKDSPSSLTDSRLFHPNIQKFGPLLHSTPNNLLHHSLNFNRFQQPFPIHDDDENNNINITKDRFVESSTHPYLNINKTNDYYSNRQNAIQRQHFKYISSLQHHQSLLLSPHHHQHLPPPHPYQQQQLQHNSSTLNSFSSPSSSSTPSVDVSSSSFSSPSSLDSMNSPSINDPKESKSANKTKRIRTIFTPEQLERLEQEFERQQYMVGTERFYLASSLNLSEAQVKVWFQNRRIKWRKQHLEQQQARLAKGDLYRDMEYSESSDNEDELMISVASSASQDEGAVMGSSMLSNYEEVPQDVST